MTDMDLAKQLMDDINPHLLDFLRKKVNSFIKWDLVRFFHDNPHAADTSENIARYIGRDARTIEDELDGLVDAGVLQVSQVSDLSIYSLAKDKEMRRLIGEFVEACNDRQFRVKAIYHVIRAMR
ncbi:MAG: hypothetical protein K8L99_19340 [Anaerolineae bacterium]|nr:hypothetical protein [Anaerolineae bacterium]